MIELNASKQYTHQITNFMVGKKATSVLDFPLWYQEARNILAQNKRMSVVDLCKELNARGYKDSRGNVIKYDTVLKGLVYYKKEEQRLDFIARNKNARQNH